MQPALRPRGLEAEGRGWGGGAGRPRRGTCRREAGRSACPGRAGPAECCAESSGPGGEAAAEDRDESDPEGEGRGGHRAARPSSPVPGLASLSASTMRGSPPERQSRPPPPPPPPQLQVSAPWARTLSFSPRGRCALATGHPAGHPAGRPGVMGASWARVREPTGDQGAIQVAEQGG